MHIWIIFRIISVCFELYKHLRNSAYGIIMTILGEHSSSETNDLEKDE